ncbi:coil containing protein [Vibrio phage 1.285.O._10N.286.55.C12]|nr:coil containing protein [Vibrio phage 1.285.O._10N.286.55.C12]
MKSRTECIEYLRDHNWRSHWRAGDCTVLPSGWFWVGASGKHPHFDTLEYKGVEPYVPITYWDVYPEERVVFAEPAQVQPTTDQLVTAARSDQAASEAVATERQIGGDHYKSLKIQPHEYIEANNLPFLEGNVVKYVTRHASKNGVQDIDKAIHYLELIKQMRYAEEQK